MVTQESFQQEVRQGMLLNQQRFAFIGTAFTLPSEIKRFVRLYLQTRDYEYLEIPTTKFTKEIKVSADKINKYYSTHHNQFIAPQEVMINYILLSMKQIKRHINITEQELNQYYNDNKDSFLIPARWQVAHILFAVPKNTTSEEQGKIKNNAEEVYKTLVNNPEQFNNLVQTRSDDQASRYNNGILPWLTASQPEFTKTLVNLTKPGQISMPIKSANGYEIFKLINYQAAKLPPFAAVKTKIHEQLLGELAEKKYAADLEKLSDLSYQSPDTLEPAAQALNLPITQTEFFTENGGHTSLTKNKQVLKAAFSKDVLAQGNNSEPLQINNDSVMVLRINKQQPAMMRPLAAVTQEINVMLSLAKAKKHATELGLTLVNSSGANLESLMHTHNLQWRVVTRAARDAEHVPAAINNVAFSLASIGNSKGFSLDNGNYAIVRLKGIYDGKFQQLDSEKQANFTEQMEVSYGNIEYDLYINSLMAKAKIEKSK